MDWSVRWRTVGRPECARTDNVVNSQLRSLGREESFRHHMAGQFDGEHTALAGHIAHAQLAVVRLDTAPRDGQAEPDPGFVGAALRERLEQALGIARRQTSAVVLDVD